MYHAAVYLTAEITYFRNFFMLPKITDCCCFQGTKEGLKQVCWLPLPPRVMTLLLSATLAACERCAMAVSLARFPSFSYSRQERRKGNFHRLNERQNRVGCINARDRSNTWSGIRHSNSLWSFPLLLELSRWISFRGVRFARLGRSDRSYLAGFLWPTRIDSTFFYA